MSQSIEQIAENWYSRLNNLKAYHARTDLTYKQKLKSMLLITILADRLLRLVPYYIQAGTPKLKEGTVFPSGVAMIGECCGELFKDHNKNESVINHTKRTLNYFL